MCLTTFDSYQFRFISLSALTCQVVVLGLDFLDSILKIFFSGVKLVFFGLISC